MTNDANEKSTADANQGGAVERILEMVREGRLTAAEGAELLRALPAGADGPPAGGQDGNGSGTADGDGRGRFRAGRPAGGRFTPEGLGIDLAHLGRIGRQVARRVEREIDQIDRGALRDWLHDGDEEERGADDTTQDLLWSGAAPEDGRLVLDVEVDDAAVRVVPDGEGDEVRVFYREGVMRGLGADALTPRVHLDGSRLVVRQRRRGVVIRFGTMGERLVVRVPRAVQRVEGVVHSHNGSVRVEDLELGRMEVRVANGAVRVRAEQAEEMELHSMNGRVDVAVARARLLRASSKNGAVSVEGAIRRLDADSANGKVVAVAAAPSDDAVWRLSAGNGRIEATVPQAPVGLRGQVRSAVGRVELDLAREDVRWLGRQPVGAEAELARPAGPDAPTLTLEARASNGNIAVRVVGPAATGAEPG